MTRVAFGIDRLLAEPGLVSGRIGLVTNDAARTAVDPQLHSRVALQRAGIRLIRLFSPEHGLTAGAPDGAAVADGVDPLTNLPVISLYGERLRPPRESLADVDAVLFDIPDVGVRFYTYIWTLSHVLEACAEAGVPLVVLDRPNPLSGGLDAAEGPVLDVENLSSFVGRAAIPIRHSLTVGELARLWNAEWKLNVALQVIRCAGWQRAMHWPDTGLPFVATSPAITRYEAALVYPGLCLFEATNLSVGRGTPFSFQAIGAPWLRAEETAERFNRISPFEVAAQSIRFRPTTAPHSDMLCPGVQLLVKDAQGFRPVAAGLLLLATVIESHREHFRWAKYPTAANPNGEGHFERLIGKLGIRETVERGMAEVHPRVRTWTGATGWRDRVNSILLYG